MFPNNQKHSNTGAILQLLDSNWLTFLNTMLHHQELLKENNKVLLNGAQWFC